MLDRICLTAHRRDRYLSSARFESRNFPSRKSGRGTRVGAVITKLPCLNTYVYSTKVLPWQISFPWAIQWVGGGPKWTQVMGFCRPRCSVCGLQPRPLQLPAWGEQRLADRDAEPAGGHSIRTAWTEHEANASALGRANKKKRPARFDTHAVICHDGCKTLLRGRI